MDITTHSVTLISIIIGIGLTEMVRQSPPVVPVAWSAVLLLLVVNHWEAIHAGIIGVN